jgi:hypothetical protein
MGHVLNDRSDRQQAATDSALLYRLHVPGALGAVEFQAASEALGFAKIAFPMLAGQGLEARVWVGKRVGACEIWPMKPHIISV